MSQKNKKVKKRVKEPTQKGLKKKKKRSISPNLKKFSTYATTIAQESSDTTSSIRKLKFLYLDVNETEYVCFVSDYFDPCTSHYSRIKDNTGPFLCNGKNNCALCAAGNPPESKILIPVFIVADKEIKILSVNENDKSPKSLFPLILNIMAEDDIESLREEVFQIRRIDKHNYSICRIDGHSSDVENIQAMKKFSKNLKKGRISLIDSCRKRSNEEWMTVSVMKTRVELSGQSFTFDHEPKDEADEDWE